ncbi:exported hypothetical protein [Desulfamplus magnetovallimortis]|uniref:PEGA domain-containing protein n=1 Tax=Desulfamplus magnetovallimortis TaxID=1246637 RepID=A0A1W1HAA3_9BACT|nr:carboxypeptidase regulatory-like domain-containing protein [Desulfamplus magnetovallimortis]SLM29352.1 exported hypothetical protein [Desulfamplus magnetovallimortis]
MKIIIKLATILSILLYSTVVAAHNYADTLIGSDGAESLGKSSVEESLTGSPPNLESVRLSDYTYVVLGFTDKTIVDSTGDDLIVHSSADYGFAEVFVFSEYADESMTWVDFSQAISFGSARGTTSFDIGRLGIQSVVAVKIEGFNNSQMDSPGYDLQYIEIAGNSVGPAPQTQTEEFVTIYGIVSDSTTELPIEGATVSVTGGSIPAGSAIVAITSSQGDYFIENVPSGTLTIETSKDGYKSTEITLPFAPGSTEVNFILEPESVSPSDIVKGYVTDAETGLPIAGADVLVNGGILSGITSEDGEYWIEGFSSTVVSVEVIADGYITQTKEEPVQDNGEPLIIDFALTPEPIEPQTSTINGIVTDKSTGLPLEGVDVSINGGTLSTLTSDQGYYVIEGITSRIVLIKVFLDGYTERTRQVTLTEGATSTFDFELDREIEPVITGSIRGTVTDSDTGEPLEGAEISVDNYEYSTTTYVHYLVDDELPGVTIITSKGYYLIEDIPLGLHTVEVFKDGYSDGYMEVELKATDRDPVVDFILEPDNPQPQTAKISGTVTDSVTGQPLAGVEITMNGVALSPLTSSQGYYQIEDVQPGQISLEFDLEDYNKATRQFTLEAGEERTLNVTLEPVVDINTGIIVGNVMDAATEEPLEIMEVTLNGNNYPMISDTGYFMFEELPPGTYLVEVYVDGYAKGSIQRSLISDEVVTINFRLEAEGITEPDTGSIRGNVTDSVTGQPLAGVLITMNGVQLSSFTSSQGYYQIEDVQPGQISLEFDLEDYNKATRQFTLEAGEERTLNVTLEPVVDINTGIIVGAVVDDETEELLSGIEVTLNRNDYPMISDTGYFIIEELPPGTYLVEVFVDGYKKGTQQVTITEELVAIDFRLEPEESTDPVTGSISGTITDDTTGQPLTGAEVAVDGTTLSAKTSAQGRYLIQGIPLGDYSVKASLTGYSLQTKYISITSDQLLTLNFQMEKEATLSSSVQGKVVDAATYEPIDGAAIKIMSQSTVIAETTTSSSGIFVLNGLPSGAYSAQVSATGYTTKKVDRINLVPGESETHRVELESSAPKIIDPIKVTPEKIEAGANQEVTFNVTVYDPDGANDITRVFLGHELLKNIFGTAGVEMTRVQLGSDATTKIAYYQFKTTLLSSLPPRDYPLNVVAQDKSGFHGVKTVDFSVIQNKRETIAYLESFLENVNNTFENQTLVISVNVAQNLFGITSSTRSAGTKSGSSASTTSTSNTFASAYGLSNAESASDSSDFLYRTDTPVTPGAEKCGDCYVEVMIYKPDDTLYNTEPYIICESEDITIENAESGDWTYETTSHCASSLDVEIETRGADTAVLTGIVRDSSSGKSVADARVQWNLGGETYSSDDGYFSTVVVAGEGLITTSLEDYLTNLKSRVVLTSGETKKIQITIAPENSSNESVPDTPAVEEISSPLAYPDPYYQPFAAGVIDSNLVLSANFPPYESSVWIYLGITTDLPGLNSYIFLFDSNNGLAPMTGTPVAWREGAGCCKWQQDDQILTFPVDLLPKGNYVFYSLVTAEPDGMPTFDLRYFTLDLTSD